MDPHTPSPPPVVLSDISVDVRVKLSACSAAVVLLYIYGDLFGFFRQSIVSDVVAGRAGFIGTQGGLLAAAAVIALPSVTVVLSLVLAAPVSRWLNIGCGVAYTIIMLVTMPGAWWHYLLLGALETGLTLVIYWLAWRWPRVSP